jgi:hypothetical protein
MARRPTLMQLLVMLCTSLLVEMILISSPEKDDNDAIDKSNIIEGKTRGAAKPAGTYQEPGDNEGMPAQ